MAGTSPIATNADASARSPQGFQFGGQFIGPLGDAACPETYYVVSRAGHIANDSGEIGRLLQRDHFAVAVRAQPEHKVIAVDARDWRLARGVNLGDNHGIRVVETGAEFLEQRLQLCESMRLPPRDDFAVGGFARRLQHSGDLDGVMAVIIDDGDAIPLASAGESAPPSTDPGNPLANGMMRPPQLMSDGDCRRSIKRVVPARHRQMQIGDLVSHIGLAIAKGELEA